MAITYPLNFPTSFGFSTFTIGLDHAVAVAESEFTFQSQVQENQGSAWEVSGSLELLNREQSEEYNAFIASLHGRLGTFLLSPAGSEEPRGVATGTPLVKGGSQIGKELDTDGWTPNITGILKAGDFIQLGTGVNSTLHRVLVDVDSDGSGNATLDLAPKIRTAPSDNSAIVISNPKGLFRMSENNLPVSISPPNRHTIRFNARQAIS